MKLIKLENGNIVTKEKVNEFYLGFTNYTNGSMALVAFEDLEDEYPEVITTNNSHFACPKTIQLRSDSDADDWAIPLIDAGILTGEYFPIPSGYIYILDFIVEEEILKQLEELDFNFSIVEEEDL